MKQERKYYAVDMGLRRVLCSNSVRNTERVLENVVHLELLRRERIHPAPVTPSMPRSTSVQFIHHIEQNNVILFDMMDMLI